tara:strand:- start:8282 stop:9400 length:1119 start_codon:yes stop_codon:yes gene_type:complete
MHYFQTNSPIKKVGPDEYIIGDNKLDPLALIKDKELIVDKVSAKNIDLITAKLSQDISLISGALPGLEESADLKFLSGKLDTISGMLPSLEESADLKLLSGKLDTISGMLPSLEESTDLKLLSGKLDTISGMLSSLEESLELQLLSGRLDTISGLLGHDHSGIPPVTVPTNSITGTSGSFEFLNITGTLIINGIDVYPAISGLLAGKPAENAQITGIKEDIRELELAIEDLKPDGGTYSFSTSLDRSSDKYFIEFPSLFSLPPKLNVSIETTGDGTLVDHIISGINNSGYHLVFADSIQENTYVAHTMFDSNGEFAGEEAFEINDDGEIVPSNSPLISDTMWILRNQTDLELRNNIWRYNTGPEAFTDEISF